ncbi:preprotein translocase subunit SecE [Massilicoli timonensis]|uniref:preprotein translocase subunit SecE n=1 Tax=Massilicoli timonensis TaxID=2015901 RepID=UPI000C849967|nr:preprotein translocase subunit SecE [Massilicoli timonensis]HIR15812.1 preprotein translocase subunit SecE [Candidatus Onthosoma merdavium]
MKWFSIAGIRAEVHRIRWPKMKDLIANSGSVIFFTAAFALFFTLCEWIAKTYLHFIGL